MLTENYVLERLLSPAGLSLFGLLITFMILIGGKRRENLRQTVPYAMHAAFAILLCFVIDHFAIAKLDNMIEVTRWWNTLFNVPPTHLQWYWSVTADGILELADFLTNVKITALTTTLCFSIVFLSKPQVKLTWIDWLIIFPITPLPYYYIPVILASIMLIFPMSEKRYRLFFRVLGFILVITLFGYTIHLVNTPIKEMKEQINNLRVDAQFDLHHTIETSLRIIPLPRLQIHNSIVNTELLMPDLYESEPKQEDFTFLLSFIRALIVQGIYDKALTLIEKMKPVVMDYEKEWGNYDISYILTQFELAMNVMQGDPTRSLKSIYEWVEHCGFQRPECYLGRNVEALWAMGRFGTYWEERFDFGYSIPNGPYFDDINVELTKRTLESLPNLLPPYLHLTIMPAY